MEACIGGLPYENDGGACNSYLGVKKHFWYLLFSLKRSIAGPFAAPLVVSQKGLTGDQVLCKNWCLLGNKKNSSQPTKQDLGTS